MGLFTARSKQNPFAERKRREREQREAELAAAPESSPEPPAPKPEQMQAVPVDLNPDAAEYTQAPDISTYATGGVVEASEPVPVESGEDAVQAAIDAETKSATYIAIPAISPETQAKIDAVVNHTIPPVLEPVAIEQPEPESAPAEADTKRGRGRPRPQETIDRDNAVHALLVDADAETGISKESIAAELDEKEQQVYSSLRQLSKEGRAETRYVKPHGYRWFAV